MKEGTPLREGDVYYWCYKDHEEYCKRNQTTGLDTIYLLSIDGNSK